jgi:hypothetical protein
MLLQVDSVERKEDIETIQIESHDAIVVLQILVTGRSREHTDQRGSLLRKSERDDFLVHCRFAEVVLTNRNETKNHDFQEDPDRS